MKHVVEAALHAMHPFGHVSALVQIEPLVNELQQAVQFGLALGNQCGRHVELVAGQGGHVEIFIRAGLQISWFTRWSPSEPGDFLQQGFVLRGENAHVAADIVDIVLQEEMLAASLPRWASNS